MDIDDTKTLPALQEPDTDSEIIEEGIADVAAWLDFTSSIIDSLMWPIIILILALIFRASIVRLLDRIASVSWGDKKVNFDRELDEANEEANTALLSSGRVQASERSVSAELLQWLGPPIDAVARKPRQGIIDAWLEVESALEEAAERLDVYTPLGDKTAPWARSALPIGEGANQQGLGTPLSATTTAPERGCPRQAFRTDECSNSELRSSLCRRHRLSARSWSKRVAYRFFKLHVSRNRIRLAKHTDCTTLSRGVRTPIMNSMIGGKLTIAQCPLFSTTLAKPPPVFKPNRSVFTSLSSWRFRPPPPSSPASSPPWAAAPAAQATGGPRTPEAPW